MRDAQRRTLVCCAVRCPLSIAAEPRRGVDHQSALFALLRNHPHRVRSGVSRRIDRRRDDVRSESDIVSSAARGGAPLPHAKPPRAGLRPPRGAGAPILGSGTPLPKPFHRHTMTSAVRTICNCGARTARLDVLRRSRKPILSRRMAFAPRSRDAPKLFWGALRVTARKVAAKPPSHS